MKALTLALLLSLPVPKLAPPQAPHQPASHITQRTKGGKWYLAATGHAIYCYGPVMVVPSATGDLERVATFCRELGRHVGAQVGARVELWVAGRRIDGRRSIASLQSA